jgi:hypothetical protein
MTAGISANVIIDDRELQKILRAIIKQLPDGVMGRVYSRGAVQNGRRYEHYVMSSRHQAQIHQGRWQTERDLAENNKDDVGKLYTDGMRNVLRGDERNAMKAATNEALELVKDIAQTYPPPRPGQLYVRTYTLRASWDKESRL